jgi:hypothetical protein
MPVIWVASILIQVGLIIHVIRTGRNTIWIWVLVLLPMAGPIAYIAAEILPELLGGRTARRAAAKMQKAFDPTRDLREAHKHVRLTGSIDARRRFADELFAAGKHEEAIENYRAALTGLYEHDPHLMLGLARAQFANGDAAAARTTLDELIEKNPEFKSPDGHLLYARALEAEGNLEKAASEYEALAKYYGGAEAQYRQAMLFKKMGDKHQAREVLQKLLDDAELTTKHSRQLQKQWLDLAKKELAGG